MTPPTKADDCEAVLRLLADGPPEGLSMHEIQERFSAATGRSVSVLFVNDRLCDVARQIASAEGRVKGKKVKRFFLKRS